MTTIVLRIHNVYEECINDDGNDREEVQSHNDDDTISCVALVTDLCTGGDLKQYCPCPEDRARTILQQLLSALYYLHQEKNLYSHDLTTDNSTFYILMVCCASSIRTSSSCLSLLFLNV
jgi:serine/threonine protein kinase